MFYGCARVTERDLADLESGNAFAKREAMERVAAIKGIDIPLVKRALDKRNERRAVSIVAALLDTEDNSQEMRLKMFSALESLAEYVQVPTGVLIKMLGDVDPQIRDRAIRVLGKTKAKEVVPILAEQLKKEDRNKYVVIWALGEIGDSEAMLILNRLLCDKDKYIRYNAYQALKKIRETRPNKKKEASEIALWFTKRLGEGYQEYRKVMVSAFRRIERLS